MGLEATMIIIDNSEWMRNLDYQPSRLDCQFDTSKILFRSKTGSNPESTVGIMTMAKKGPEVLTNLTTDQGKILNALHNIKIGGNNHLVTAIQIAQLALKHRQNKNQRQRIIVFVGSPIFEGQDELVKLAKKMKKNNVAVDFISFGEVDLNLPKLEAFNNTVNSNQNSNLVSVPIGPILLSDAVISSSIIGNEDGVPPTLGFSRDSDFEFGVDPNMEPELAMALRLSLEEAEARQRSENQPEASASNVAEINENDEEAELLRAIQLSKQENFAGQDGDNNAEIALDAFEGLPGVDTSDPKFQEALQMLNQGDKPKDKNDEAKKE